MYEKYEIVITFKRVQIVRNGLVILSFDFNNLEHHELDEFFLNHLNEGFKQCIDKETARYKGKYKEG